MIIENRRFRTANITAFADYVNTLTLPQTPTFHPQFVVVHNTSSPSLAQRPAGLTDRHIANLKSYYEGLGWHAGPHLFVTDRDIIVFTSLTKDGVHSPSWNHMSFGVELLGEYETESFTTGRGQAVAELAAYAVSVLCKKMGVAASTIRFHKEDTQTTHRTCPGENVRKPAFVARVAALLLPDAPPNNVVELVTPIITVANPRELHGDGTWNFTPVVEGQDIVVRNVKATRWGGADDAQDSGMTASGFSTRNHPHFLGVALPMRRGSFAATAGSPIPPLPWNTAVKVYSLKTGKIAYGQLIDIGPAKSAGKAIDLTNALVEALDLDLDAGVYDVSYRIIGGAGHIV